jgi:hypothetical protein
MRHALPLLLLVAVAAPLAQEERPVPDDSTRITIPGCASGRTFVIAEREGHEPASAELRPGRRFRLSGPGETLNEIRIREGRMIEVTGLVRKADLGGPGGRTVGAGRVRIGGGVAPRAPLGGGSLSSSPQQGVALDAVLDVEGWVGLPESCPAR